MTKMISCIVIVLLISVPEGSFQTPPDASPTTMSTSKQTTETPNPSSATARSTTEQLTDQSTTVNPSGHSTTEHLASQSSQFTTNNSTVWSTTDRSTTDGSSTYKSVSEHTSPSQTTLEQFNSTTINQTTQLPVTKSKQTTSQSTRQPEKSTVEKTYEYTMGTARPTGQNNATSIIALEGKGEKYVAGNPGLIAVLCIFFSTLALVLVIMIVKVVQARRPQFERLDDLPMGEVSEDAPFARYRAK